VSGRRLRWCSSLGRGARSAQDGQAIVWAAVMLPLFLSVVGLTVDAGIVFDARRELQNVADSAARAGAMQVDQQAYRASSGSTVVLDQAAARRVAATIAVEPQRVVVQASSEVPTSFLRLAGITSVRVSATAPAEVRYGIDRPNR
jgi:Flp pilus assembly protein TadG